MAAPLRDKVENALSRFSDHITRVELHLSDENADKSGQHVRDGLQIAGAADLAAQAGRGVAHDCSEGFRPVVWRTLSFRAPQRAFDHSRQFIGGAVESDRLPAFIASLNYFNDNGDDPFKPVPIGSGFRAANVSLSALKRMEPVVLYGGLAYTHAFARDVNADNLLGESTFHGRIDPGDAWSYRFGVSLAATPEITLDASLSGAFIRGTDVRSDAAGSFTLPKSTIVMVNLGAGFILARNLSLQISASAGATDNSPDFIFSASLPYRF